MAVFIALGYRRTGVFGNFFGVMLIVVSLVSDKMSDIPGTGQCPDSNEQRSAPPGRPESARRRH